MNRLEDTMVTGRHPSNTGSNTGARHRQRAFTLVELMISIAIIGILASISMTSYRQYIIKARISNALSELVKIRTDVAAALVLDGHYDPLDYPADYSSFMVHSVSVQQFIMNDPVASIEKEGTRQWVAISKSEEKQRGSGDKSVPTLKANNPNGCKWWNSRKNPNCNTQEDDSDNDSNDDSGNGGTSGNSGNSGSTGNSGTSGNSGSTESPDNSGGVGTSDGSDSNPFAGQGRVRVVIIAEINPEIFASTTGEFGQIRMEANLTGSGGVSWRCGYPGDMPSAMIPLSYMPASCQDPISLSGR